MHDEMVEYTNEEGDVFLFEQGEWWWVDDMKRCSPGEDDSIVESAYMAGYGWVLELGSFNRWRGEMGFPPIPAPFWNQSLEKHCVAARNKGLKMAG